MLMVRVYLAPSPIEGMGVFAREPIEAGQLVWQFDERFDRLIRRGDYNTLDAMHQEFVDRYSYINPLFPEHYVLDADEARYINHADDANCDMSDPMKSFARRAISAGTELTCDYRQFGYDNVYFMPTRHP